MRHIRKSRKPKDRTKRTTVERHFAARCMQRLGYIPDSNEIIDQIQRGRLEQYDRQSNRLTRWRWRDPVHGVDCIIPYDKQRKQLVTILFQDIEKLKKGESKNEDKVITNDAKSN